MLVEYSARLLVVMVQVFNYYVPPKIVNYVTLVLDSRANYSEKTIQGLIILS